MKKFDNLKDELKRITPAEMEMHGIIQAAKNGGYICPACGNGQGDDGTGINPGELANGYEYHCFKCDKSFDNIGLLANYFNLDATKDFTEIVKRGSEMFNVSENSFTAPKKTETQKKQPPKEAKDFSHFFKVCAAQIENLPESQRRNLTIDTLKRFGC